MEKRTLKAQKAAPAQFSGKDPRDVVSHVMQRREQETTTGPPLVVGGLREGNRLTEVAQRRKKRDALKRDLERYSTEDRLPRLAEVDNESGNNANANGGRPTSTGALDLTLSAENTNKSPPPSRPSTRQHILKAGKKPSLVDPKKKTVAK